MVSRGLAKKYVPTVQVPADGRVGAAYPFVGLTFDDEEDTARDDEKVDDRLHKVAPVPCHRKMLLCNCPR